jgi:hypothetical protein
MSGRVEEGRRGARRSGGGLVIDGRMGVVAC